MTLAVGTSNTVADCCIPMYSVVFVAVEAVVVVVQHIGDIAESMKLVVVAINNK